MEAALRALLTGYAPLTALVGQRIYWNALPQSVTRPAIVLFKISGVPGITHNGSDGLVNSIVQIDIQTKAANNSDAPVTQMWAIRDIILARLHGYHDATFKVVVAQSERQDSDELAGGGLVHRASIDFSVWSVVTQTA